MNLFCSLIVAACCALASARVVRAQETINFASVSGRVTDSQGGVVPGALVSARQLDTNVVTETETNADGRFRFPYLRVGTYEVKVQVSGFVDSIRILNATVSSAFDIPVVLAVAGLEASVMVTGESTTLEAARSQIAGTLPQTEIQKLPLNGRNFLDLALLIPGVSPTNIGSTQLFAETSAVPGQGISIASQRNLSNNFVVDGLSANDDAAGLGGMTYSVDAIEQFQVVTSGGQAELGRALGGFINVVTKSGTNALRGTLYDYVRDDTFNAPNALSGTTLPMNQHQYGGSLGGPIARNRTFFFSNFEQRLFDQTGLVTILPANVALINRELAATGYPGSFVTTGIYPNPVHSANLIGKLDHHVSGSDHLTVKYSLYHVTADNARGAGALNAPTASSALDNIDQSLGFGNMWTMSPRTVNETRAQFVHSDLKAPPTDTVGPAVNIAGVASFGTSSGSPTRRTNKMYQVVNTLSHQAGVHAVRGGVDVVFNDDTITYPRSARGNYSFSSLANFLTGNYSGFTQTFGDPVVAQTNPNIGLYVQDKWRAASGTLLVAATLSGRATDGAVAFGVKGRANMYASVAASGRFVAVVWGARTGDGVTDIYVATSSDGGRGFSAPTRVNVAPGDASLTGGQPPRIALLPREQRVPSMVVVWTSKAPAGTRLLSARSDDAGRSFTSPIPVPGSEAAGNRGWESITTTRDGAVVALWLDHRDSSSSRGRGTLNHEAHQHLHAQTPTDGVARAQLSRLFFATMGQADSPRSITGGVCYCCKTAIATDASGGVYAAWRHVYPGNVRDIAFSKSTDGGRTFTSPARISDDNWVLDGCPENGPAMVVDRTQRVHVVWPTLVLGATPAREPTMALFYATSPDGRRFTARQQLPTEGVPRHPQIALGNDAELVVAWDEQAKGTRRVALAFGSVDANGTARFARQSIGDTLRAEYPAIAKVDDGTIVVWTSGATGQTVIRTARLMN